MKKTMIAASVAALALCSSAFADVSVGAWGRSGLNAVIDTDDISASYLEATPDWASGSRVGVNFGASNPENTIGFKLNLDSNGGTVGVGDQAKIYGSLFDCITVQFGKIQLDTLRGSIGDWGNRTSFSVAGEDTLFTRFNPSKGATVSFDSNGLFIGAAIDSSVTVDSGSSSKLGDIFAATQAGIGYTINDLMQIKAQYIGDATSDSWGTVEAGVDLLMIPQNVVETGVKVVLADKVGVQGTVGLSGHVDSLSYIAHVTDSYSTSNYFGFDAGAEYDFGPCAMGVTGGFSYDTEAKFGVESYAKKAYSNGYLFGGAAYSTSKGVYLPVGIEFFF